MEIRVPTTAARAKVGSMDGFADRSPTFIQLDEPDAQAPRDELLAGLQSRPASIAPKFLYDALGSRLFDAITALEEYYPTRTEAAIVERHGAEIAAACAPGQTLVDLGAGNCAKAAKLFATLKPPRYVAVDIAAAYLRDALERLQRAHPQIEMLGLGVDLSRSLRLPAEAGDGPRTVFFPGSSIGNFSPAAACEFLRSCRAAARGGSLLIGVDLLKPRHILEPAYDDALGVTAAFNLNLLRHVNALIGADFDVRQWRHVARFDATRGCIEMRLAAREDVRVHWAGGERQFLAGEHIHTEDSFKYRRDDFAALLRDAGFRQLHWWTDDREWFAVFVARG